MLFRSTYGIDAVHFGVFTVVTMLIGCITPPVGMLLFVASAIGKIKVSQVYRSIIPMVIVLAFIALVIALIPGIVTWIPGMLM